MLTHREKTVNNIFNDLAEPIIDFNPDFVYPALTDAYDEGNKHGIFIGTLFTTAIYFIGRKLVRNKNKKSKESE